MKRPRIRPHCKVTPEYTNILRQVELTSSECHDLDEVVTKIIAGYVYCEALERGTEYLDYKERQKKRRLKELKRARAYRKEHGDLHGFRPSAHHKAPAAVSNAWLGEGMAQRALDRFLDRAVRARKKLSAPSTSAT